MSLLSYVYRNGLWISVPLFIGSTMVLIYLIRDIMRIMREAQLVSLPIVEEQAVEFPEAGKVVLCMEGPRFTTRFARLSYSLIGPEGREVKGRRSWFRFHTSGMSKVRMELRYYGISIPGQHTLQIRGLEPGKGPDAEHRIVFMRSHLAKSLARVLGIVLTSMVLIGSVVLFFMRLVGNGDAS